MNGDWNPSNNLKKTCLDFTLAIGVQRVMGLGIFRDLDIEENPSFSTPPPCLQVFGDFTLAIKVKRERDYEFEYF